MSEIVQQEDIYIYTFSNYTISRTIHSKFLILWNYKMSLKNRIRKKKKKRNRTHKGKDCIKLSYRIMQAKRDGRPVSLFEITSRVRKIRSGPWIFRHGVVTIASRNHTIVKIDHERINLAFIHTQLLI